MRKKSKLSTVIIIFLLIVVGAIFAYIFMEDKELDKKVMETVNKIQERKEEEPKEEEVSLDDEIVKTAINDLNSISAVEKYDDFKIESLDKYRLILTAINGLSEDQITWCISSPKQIKSTITIEDLNKSLNKYINNKEITIEDIINNKGESGLTVGKYGYDMFAINIEGNNIHVIGSCDGKGPGVLTENVVTNQIKATKKDDELYIYTKVAYGKINSTTNDLKYDYYKDSKKEQLVETLPSNGNLTWDKYNTFKQTYKKIDNKYYFVSSKIDK